VKDLGEARDRSKTARFFACGLRMTLLAIGYWSSYDFRHPTRRLYVQFHFPEELEQLIPDAGIQILFAERARDVDRGPHLVEIPSTALARSEVSVEPLSIGFRKRRPDSH
jgi:hypothetical protein